MPSVVKAEEEEFTTEHTERPKSVTEYTEGVGSVGGRGATISVRDAPQKEKFRSILSVPLCGKESSFCAVSAVMKLDWKLDLLRTEISSGSV